jgi:hypothetical protein
MQAQKRWMSERVLVKTESAVHITLLSQAVIHGNIFNKCKVCILFKNEQKQNKNKPKPKTSQRYYA